MLCVYGHYKYVYSFSAGVMTDYDVYRRHNLTPEVGPRAERVNIARHKARISPNSD